MATISEALAIAVQHHQAGRLQAAEQIYRQILTVEPNHADALHLLGVIACQLGKHGIAVEYIRRAIRLNANVADYHLSLGNALKDQGNLDEAVACYRRAVKLMPDDAEAHNNLGNVLKDQQKVDEAVACYRQAMKLRSDFAGPHCNLGVILQDQGKLDEAVASYRRALQLEPDYVVAHNNLGITLKDQGKLDEAIACFRRALELKPDYVVAHDNLLCALQYCTGVSPAALAEAHAEYDRRHAAFLRAAVAGHENAHDRHGQLRLGFVSSDLGRHPVGYFLVRVLENLDKEQVETICYSDRSAKDDLTARLQSAATQWRDVFRMKDQQLAEQIRADRIDILFDLAGHTANNRLLVFARKPAPIQITWIGYMCTTGLEAMDYLLADRYEVPESAERYYRERILRMPDGHICYDPPGYAPAVSALPASAAGHVTFGCFNNPAKVTPLAIEVWAKILRRLPRARLVLKFKGWNDSGIARRVAEMFVTQGIDPGRLEFLGLSPHAELLGEYGRIDVALDTLPYSGCLTTCEALWMGVPVITYPGETLTSRQSSSCIANAGLTETITRDLDEYVEVAVSMASDLPRLAMLRAGLRQRMAASPLCDGVRFARSLTSLLRNVWEQRVG